MIVNWIGIVIGVLGLAFAAYQHSQRARVESVVRDTLRRLAGEMRVVFSNANWADLHFRNIGFMYLEAEPDLKRIRREALDGARDAPACTRQLALVHSKIRGIQQSLFKDSLETLPEIKSDDVLEAEKKLGTYSTA